MDETLMEIFRKSISQEKKAREIREYLKTLPHKNVPPSFWESVNRTEKILDPTEYTKTTAGGEIRVQPLLNVPRIPSHPESIVPWNAQFQIMKPSTKIRKQIINLTQATVRVKRQIAGEHVEKLRSCTASVCNAVCKISLNRHNRSSKKPDLITLWRSKNVWSDELDDEELQASNLPVEYIPNQIKKYLRYDLTDRPGNATP